ncbi:hypothetical protein [Tahibacter soli]|uniref:SPOR domain-containing protein n=1 Tax=Tahibacter soli TaxID=2983605 RepID=A0A9X3YHY1_9GAMM|nr:hypothetical protein [Tahibacter soli]MDC8011341.1 hypothetical protein [Tahibacter soli]
MSVDVRHSLRAAGIGFALALMPYVACAQQDEHIFEPGKKHVCVPAADRKSWNCGSADNPPAATPKADGPALRSARATDLSDSERAAAAAAMEPAAAPSEPPAAIASPSSSGSASGRTVPSYLLAPEAASAPVASSAPPPAPKSEPPPAAPVEAKPVAAAPVEVKAAEPPPVDTKPAAPPPLETAAPVVTEAKPPAPEPEPERVVTQAKPAAPEPPTTAPKPRTPEPPAAVAAPTEPPAAIAAPVATEVSSEPVVAPKAAEATPQAAPPSEPVRTAAPSLRHADAFRTLADSRYVLELARGADRSAVEAAAAQATLPRGEVYLLALTRDGASWYVALWGDFDSIDSARAARGEALASGIADVGWPRRVGPLKQELKLVR